MKKVVHCNHNKPVRWFSEQPEGTKQYFAHLKLFRVYNENSRKTVQEYTFDALGVTDTDALYDALSGILDTLGYTLKRKEPDTIKAAK